MKLLLTLSAHAREGYSSHFVGVASGVFLEVEEGGQDGDEEAVKVYLIRFIADLLLRLVYGLRS